MSERIAEETKEKIQKLYKENVNIADIARQTGVSYSTAYGYTAARKRGFESRYEYEEHLAKQRQKNPEYRELSSLLKNKLKELGVKMIGVNHCIAHLEIGQSVGARNPVLLYASGANTQIIAFAAGKYRVFGETLDIGVGNFIDKFARYIGIGFPGGPEIEKKALGGEYIELPYSIKGMDVSFSGMQTKLQQLYDKGFKIEDLSFSLQETAFAMLVEAAERAMAHTGKNELVLGGGVACNARLQEMCKIMCSERNAKYFCPAHEFLVDNAAMIAFTGEIIFNSGIFQDADEIEVKPRERTDDVEVSWR